ncbi:phage portal protein family protein [Phocaeicola plebeius]|uniref:phage portal protein family protein n=1 Tax=Phocaeicola plebeius TaxID=310297 RepID=UPI003FD8DEDB
MSRKKNKNKPGIITVGGNFMAPGQKKPNVIVLTQPKRFGLDIADYMSAIRAAENVDFSRRYKLYDLYSDILMDTHLTCVIEKRKNAVLCSDIEFQVNGKPDETVNEQIRSPWFNKLIGDIIDARFWGFSLCQFYKEGEWVDYDLVPRKHVDPIKKLILRHQTDVTGLPWDKYTDLLFIGSPSDLGLLAKAAPWVIYKRNTTGDWSQFSEIFGMPIQEYIYDSDDEESRQRAMEDAANTGSLAQFFHAKDTEFKLTEAGNKTGSADVYERLCERCNNEISKLVLGNTLTTESSENGTQALGTVHKKVEDKVAQADKNYVLNVLNYDMSDIFARMGINTAGGVFCFPEKKEIDSTTKLNIITTLKSNFNLPVSDDYLYEEFGVEKPDNYEQIKKEREEQPPHNNIPVQAPETKEEKDPEPTPAQKKSFRNWIASFFGKAPSGDGAALDW